MIPAVLKRARTAMQQRKYALDDRYNRLRVRYCQSRGGHRFSDWVYDLRDTIFGEKTMPCKRRRCERCDIHECEDTMSWEEFTK